MLDMGHTQGSFGNIVKKEGDNRPGTAEVLSVVTAEGQGRTSPCHCCLSLGGMSLNDRHSRGAPSSRPRMSPASLVRGRELTDVASAPGAPSKVRGARPRRGEPVVGCRWL